MDLKRIEVTGVIVSDLKNDQQFSALLIGTESAAHVDRRQYS